MHNVPSTRKAEQSTVYTSGALGSMHNVPSTRKAEQITVYSAPAKVKTRVHRHPYNKPGDIVQRSIKCSGLADKTVYILQDKREDDDVNESVIQDVIVDCSEAEHRSKEPGLNVLDILNQGSSNYLLWLGYYFVSWRLGRSFFKSTILIFFFCMNSKKFWEEEALLIYFIESES